MQFIAWLLKAAKIPALRTIVVNWLVELTGLDAATIQALLEYLLSLAPAQQLAAAQLVLPTFGAACPSDCDCDMPDCPDCVAEAFAKIAESGIAAEFEG